MELFSPPTFTSDRTMYMFGHRDNSSANITTPPLIQSSPATDTAAHRFVYVAEAVIQPSILGFGIITNVISLIVLRNVKMNFIFRTCLIALAMADFSTCVTGFIALVLEVSLFGGEMPFGHWHPLAVLTYGFYYSYMMFICSSASLVILIAIIRNMFIIAPMKARRYFTPRKTKVACSLTLLCTVVLFAPTSLNIIFQSCFNETDVDFCTKINQSIPKLEKISSKYLFTLTTLYGPVIILIYTVCFICIRVTVGRSVEALSSMTMKNKGSPGRDSTRKRSKAASRVTRTLLIILVLDVVCTLPTVIQGVGLVLAPKATVFDKTDVNYDVFDVVVEIFLNLRPTYNFWLYIFHHPEFRVRLRVILMGKKALRRPSGTERSLSSSDYRTENTFIRDTSIVNKRRRSSGRAYDRGYSVTNQLVT